jgi:hypothetical protein
MRSFSITIGTVLALIAAVHCLPSGRLPSRQSDVCDSEAGAYCSDIGSATCCSAGQMIVCRSDGVTGVEACLDGQFCVQDSCTSNPPNGGKL